jgi:hypothetical protein
MGATLFTLASVRCQAPKEKNFRTDKQRPDPSEREQTEGTTAMALQLATRHRKTRLPKNPIQAKSLGAIAGACRTSSGREMNSEWKFDKKHEKDSEKCTDRNGFAPSPISSRSGKRFQERTRYHLATDDRNSSIG